MSDKYDEVNGGFKQIETGDSEPDSFLREKKVGLAGPLGVLAAHPERFYPANDNPYKGWSAEQLQAEIEKLKGQP